MKVVKQFLTAIVTKAEYDQGIGHEYPNLFMVTEDFSIFKRTKLAEGGSCLLKVPELPKMEATGEETKEEINFLPGGKIPFDYLNQIISFFKKVMEVNFGGSSSSAGENCEAMAHILWNKVEKKYEIGIPTQNVSKASVTYEFDHIDQEKHVIIVDIHSHNTMGAFFSGTDDTDDKKGCWFAGVAGQLNRDVCQVKFRFTNFGNFREVKLDELFDSDATTLTITDNVPNEWMDKVKGKYTSTYGGTYGGGRQTQHLPRHQGSGGGGRGGRHSPDGTYQGEFGWDRNGIDDRLSWMYADMRDDIADDDFWLGIGFPPGNYEGGNWQRDVDDARGRAYRGKGNRHPARRGKQNRVDAATDYFGRSRDDAIEAIEDMQYPMCRSHIKAVLEAVIDKVKEGIRDDDATSTVPRSQYDTFLLEMAESFAEEFSEIYEGEDIETYQIPFIVSCLQQHADWNSLVQIHDDLLDFMASTYKDNAHMDVLVDYLCENESLLSAENFHRLKEILKDAQVQH